MLRGFIFDVEGTLVTACRRTSAALSRRSIASVTKLRRKRLQLYSGLDGDRTLQLVLPDAKETERKAILKAQGAIYEERYLGDISRSPECGMSLVRSRAKADGLP